MLCFYKQLYSVTHIMSLPQVYSVMSTIQVHIISKIYILILFLGKGSSIKMQKKKKNYRTLLLENEEIWVSVRVYI